MEQMGYACLIITIYVRVEVHVGDLDVRCAFLPRLQVKVEGDAVSGAMKSEEFGRPIM